MAPKTDLDEKIEEQSQNGLIRVIDDEGHLLFKYNPHTREIEFIPIRGRRLDGRGRVKCMVSTDLLRSLGSRNLLVDSPTHEVVAKVIEISEV